MAQVSHTTLRLIGHGLLICHPCGENLLETDAFWWRFGPNFVAPTCGDSDCPALLKKLHFPHGRCGRCERFGPPQLLAKDKRWRRLALGPYDELTDMLISIFGHGCGQCGWTGELEIDHYVPLARGGTDYLTNLWLLCHECNSTKWAHTPDELADIGERWATPHSPDAPIWPRRMSVDDVSRLADEQRRRLAPQVPTLTDLP